MKHFCQSEFNYSPLTWMFCNRRANNRINKLHEQALRLVYDDYEALFSDFLAKDGSITAYDTNVQTLLLELKCIKNITYLKVV